MKHSKVLATFLLGTLALSIATVSHANEGWLTTQTATAVCSGNIAQINLFFKNDEKSGGFGHAMDVIANDQQSTGSANLGTIYPDAEAVAVISRNTTSISAGQVNFLITWSNSRPGTDTEIASYSAINCAPTAAYLGNFSAVAKNSQKVILNWESLNELNVIGFNAWRSTKQNTGQFGPFLKINPNLLPSQNPGSIIGANYRYVDGTVKGGKTYRYKLEVISVGGNTLEWSNIIKLSTPAN